MATPSQTMAVAMPRRRSRSPAGGKRIRLNDVSSARAAGSSEMQLEQKPYLNNFMAALAKEYPQNTKIEEAQTKLGSFVIPVFSAPHIDIVDIARKIKLVFPLASVVPGDSPGEVHWELPYVREHASRNWGDIATSGSLCIVALVLAYFEFFGSPF